MSHRPTHHSRIALSLMLAAAVSGCGGGGGGSSSGSGSTATATLSGTALGGRFLSGEVCAYALTGGVKGAQLGCAAIDPATSTYSIDVGSYTGDALLEIGAGAAYDDEANPNDNTTGTPVGAGTLRSVASVSGVGTVAAALTPLTEAALRAATSLAPADVAAAAAQIRTDLGLDPQLDLFDTQPALSATTGQQLAYREALRALSQMQYGNPTYQSNLSGYLDHVAQNHATLKTQFDTELNNGLSSGCTLDTRGGLGRSSCGRWWFCPPRWGRAGQNSGRWGYRG